MLRNLLQNWVTGGTKQAQPTSKRVRPQVESLEDRLVMDQSFRYWTTEAVEFRPVTLGSFHWLNRQASDFKVTVTWGDGQKTTTQPTEEHNDYFVVTAGHRYDNEGPYANVKVTATDKVTGRTWQVSHGEFVVRNAKLELVQVKAVEVLQGQTFSGELATFRDTRALGADSVGHYKAIINWGEGPLAFGHVVREGNLLHVVGTHRFNRRGTFNIRVKFMEDNGGQWREASVFLNYRDGGMADAYTTATVYKNAAARDLAHACKAVQEAWQEFKAGFGDSAGNLLKFLSSDAYANQKAIAGAIMATVQTIVTNPGRATQGLLDAVKEALRQAQANPARFLGGLTFDILLGKFGKLAQAKLISVGKKLPGLTNFNLNQGFRGLDPRLSKQLEGVLESPRSLLNRQILAGYVMRTSKVFDQINPWRSNTNCGNVSAAGVYALRDGIIHTASFAGPMEDAQLVAHFGRNFSQYMHGPQFLTNLKAATRPGSVGIIAIETPSGGGHFLNYINMNGQLHFVDFQHNLVYTDLQQYIRTVGYDISLDKLSFLDCTP